MTNEQKREYAFWAVGLLVLTLIVFRQVLVPGYGLFTTDDNLGALVLRKNLLPHAWWGGWHDGELLGSPAPVFFNLTNLLLFVLPAATFNNWINAFDLLVGSVFLVLFLRMRGLSRPACALGVLTAYWLGSNFTLVYAGHIGKFGILLWVPLYLWLIEHAVKRNSPYWSVLAGGALGAMFLEQADVALFFALILGPYALYAWWRERGWAWVPLVRFISPIVIVSFLLAAHPLLSGYAAAVEGVAAVQDEDPRAKWEFVTQWSWPPEESIDFIAPGFTGWRSGEPSGPYIGRMGRSAGWEEAGQGFRNFKLENQYLGAIPVLFALLALFLAVRFRRAPDRRMPDGLFWGAAMLLALLLSFGKHFPLYTLFYQLPAVSSIRNPNKFLQVFQFALAILAAYGFHELIRHVREESKRALQLRELMPVLIGGAVLGVVLLLWGLGSMAAWDNMVANYSREWGQYATAIVENRVWALLHGGVMACLGALLMYLLVIRRGANAKVTAGISWCVLALVTFDVLFLSRHYVATFETGAMDRNEVVRIVKSDPQGARVALISQEGFYNMWLSILFPYHDVPTINVAQMPRMPVEYQQYLGAVGRNLLRHWELGGVGFVLGHGQIWSQITNDPTVRDRFELIFAYNTEPKGGGVIVTPASEERPGHHVLLRHRAPHYRYALIAGWEFADDQRVLGTLGDPAYQPFERALIAPEFAELGIPPSEGSGVNGGVRRTAYRSGQVTLRVSAEEPSILRIADKYDPHWRAEVNGVRTPVLRVDYLVQGIYLNAGMHDVVLRYAPPTHTLWLQAVGMLACFGALGVVIRRRRQKADA